MTLALLMFNLDRNDGIIRNINLLEGTVDEILIIDSSSSHSYLNLSAMVRGHDTVRVIRALPMGYPDPLRVFALTHIKSDFVLYLDSDEEPNPKLVEFLGKMKMEQNKASGFYILRYDSKQKYYEYTLRIFNRNSIEFKGIIHEPPVCNGKTQKLGKDIFIIHRNSDVEVLENKSYMVLESYERPFTKLYLTTISGGHKFYRVLLKPKNEVLPTILIYLLIISETIVTLIMHLQRSMFWRYSHRMWIKVSFLEIC